MLVGIYAVANLASIREFTPGYGIQNEPVIVSIIYNFLAE